MDRFAALRPSLLGLAYRLLGSRAEAEDVVQEAWLRWSSAVDVRDDVAFLRTVVTRLCLDELRSARRRRQAYVGPWLPEPVQTADGALGPLETAELRDSLSLGFLVLLDRFLTLVATADLPGLTALLTDDAVLVSDGGGLASAARQPVVGADRVARFLLGLASRLRPGQELEVGEVNGGPALLLRTGGALTHVTELVPDGDRVRGICIVVSPLKPASVPC